ncbi:phosphodiester glycosidase family protein [Paenibacillus pabuli]|uniref:phosphodiester glycosidase family protein n=1 Tax=Paenibacillus pabuli TaxID=1472 RepID=UPI000785C113|nr:phosphodiester glycosidase family protein [Paenibacillus pabuli]MEC0126772.1 phosphodiester glycosidase family protein [Paenibacillus pabuli]
MKTKRTGKWWTGAMALVLALPVILSGAVGAPQTADAKAAISTKVQNVKAAGRSFTVQTVSIPKGTPVTVGLAKKQVGQTATLPSIVKAYGAQAAINGAFFEAYNGAPDPYGMLIANGKVIHIGRYGTTIGFKEDGSAVMDSLQVSLTGKVTDPKGKSRSWYATFINRTPSANASITMLYTPERGSTVGFKGGTAVVMEKGVVTKKVPNTNVAIPKNGSVLVFTGNQKSSSDRFTVGSTVEMNYKYTNAAGKEIPWEDVVTAVGAGPRLVKDGKVAVSPASEGFKDTKILNASGARSGIAIMADGSVMLATVSGATVKEWAAVMQKLGAKQAMNLDGGASSGMYAGGKMLTSPGRLLSNTLVFGGSVR